MHSLRPLIAALALLAACALAPSTAAAWAPAGERPGRTPLVNEAVAIGERYWAARNVTPCPDGQLDVRVADDLGDGADGRGEMGGCVIWLRSALVAAAMRYSPGSATAVYVCRIVTHELGHTAGLPDGLGVMDPAAEYGEGTPRECRALRSAHQAAAASSSPAVVTMQAPSSIRAAVARARVPVVNGQTVLLEPCPGTAMAVGCTYMTAAATVYIRPSQFDSTFTLYHELGHRFDAVAMTRWSRTRFLRIVHRHRWGQVITERFADAYAGCAYDPRHRPFEALGADGYRFTQRQHRRVCRLIMRVGARAGLSTPAL